MSPPVSEAVFVIAEPDRAEPERSGGCALAGTRSPQRSGGLIGAEALVLVSRDADGKIHGKDKVHNVGVGAALGAAGGLIVGLIFPPSLLAAGAVGAGIGAGVGGLVSHGEKKEIKAEVADDLPPGSSGIVGLFDPTFATAVEKTMANATNVSKHEIDPQSVADAKAAAPDAS
jgi:uncharacterized membrane protein